MLAKLKELGIGLFVAIGLLILVSRLIANNQPKNNRPQSDKTPPPHSNAALCNTDPTSALNAVDFSGPATTHQIYISATAAGENLPVGQVEALAHLGLKGDRYHAGKGHWSESDNCEITMIAQEDLDKITATTSVQVQQGQHRRNLVTRGIHLPSLAGKRFQIGSALFAYDRPRPPCQYIQQITEPGMVKALAFHSGICVRCFRSGTIQVNDRITLLTISPIDLIKRKIGQMFQSSINTH